jgi:peptidoglycan/LPS O-acetylase OafA/YrhL
LRARPNLTALTGVRWFAALHVVIFHLGQPMLVAAPKWVRNIAAAGHVGVTLFFVLSGFILAYTYFERTNWTAGSFWWARVARVYPVYVLAFALSAPHAVKEIFASGVSAGSLLVAAASAFVALTLTQAWFPPFALLWNVPAWSLSVEAFFYFLFPWLARKISRPEVSSAKLVLVGGLTWAIGLLAPIVYTLCNSDGAGRPIAPETTGLWITLLKYVPIAHLPEFIVGAVAGELFLRELRSGVQRGAAILTPAVTAAVFVVLAFSASIPYLLLHNGLLTPLFAVLVYSLAREGSVVARFLALPLLVLLGDASYAVYLLHLQLAWSTRFYAAVAPVVLRVPALHFIGHVVPLTIACVAIYRWFEMPLRTRLRKMAPSGGASST